MAINSAAFETWLNRGAVESPFIALFCWWIIWALVLLARYLAGGYKEGNDNWVHGDEAWDVERAKGRHGGNVATSVSSNTDTRPYEPSALPTGAGMSTIPGTATTTTTVVTKKKGLDAHRPYAAGSIASRLERSHRVLRDFWLMTLGALIINTFGIGNASGVAVITWIIFGLVLVWAILELIVNVKPIIRFLVGFLILGLISVIFILAFAAGWSRGDYNTNDDEGPNATNDNDD